MKIIYLHQYFKFPNESGATRSYDLAKELTKRGYDVTVVTSTSNKRYKKSKRWSKVTTENLTIHYLYLPYKNHYSYLKRALVFLQFIWFSILKILSLQTNLVLATSTPLTIGIPALVKKWLHKTPFIFEVRDVWPEAVIAIGAVKNKLLKAVLYKLEFIIYKNASMIVPLSVDMKQSIVSRYSQFENKIKVIENIAEINRFQVVNENKSIIKNLTGSEFRFTVLYAGTFGRVNGIDYVIELAERLIDIDQSIVFVLIGDGAKKRSIVRKAKEKNVYNRNVFILDPVGKQDLPQLYYEASMGSSFVIDIKELWANSANKFFDSLAASRPILINYLGWQKKIIENENIGYVLPPKLTKGTVEEFIEFTYNKDLRSKQRKNAFSVAKKLYALNVAVDKYVEVIKKVNKLSDFD